MPERPPVNKNRERRLSNRTPKSSAVHAGKKQGEGWAVGGVTGRDRELSEVALAFRSSSYLEVAVRGGDVERGEAVEERGAGEQGGAGAKRGGEAGRVPGLRRAEEVYLVAWAAAASAVPHRRRPAASGEREGGKGRGTGWLLTGLSCPG